eukprot:1732958-Pleurochrysis_carterae.AAC.1
MRGSCVCSPPAVAEALAQVLRQLACRERAEELRVGVEGAVAFLQAPALSRTSTRKGQASLKQRRRRRLAEAHVHSADESARSLLFPYVSAHPLSFRCGYACAWPSLYSVRVGVGGVGSGEEVGDEREGIEKRSEEEGRGNGGKSDGDSKSCLLYTSPSPRDGLLS